MNFPHHYHNLIILEVADRNTKKKIKTRTQLNSQISKEKTEKPKKSVEISESALTNNQ